MSEHIIPRFHVANDLSKVINLLDRVGWVQNKEVEIDPMTNEVVGYCIGGAVNAAHVSSDLNSLLNTYFCTKGFEGFVEYNDTYDRTKGEVIATLKELKQEIIEGKVEIV